MVEKSFNEKWIIGYSNLIFQGFAPIIALSDCLEISSDFMARISYIFCAIIRSTVRYITMFHNTMQWYITK